jgi:hypothetical protein
MPVMHQRHQNTQSYLLLHIHHQQITTECLTRIGQINIKWQIPTHLAVNISLQLGAWVSNEQSPPITEAATNQTHLAALQSQACIGWGQFFKGFCATDFQQVINEQTSDLKNAFKQIQWTCEIVQCVWDSEVEHWKLQNGDKHSHTPQETDNKKRAQLLTAALVLLQNHKLPCHTDTKHCSLAYPNYNQMHTKPQDMGQHDTTNCPLPT